MSSAIRSIALAAVSFVAGAATWHLYGDRVIPPAAKAVPTVAPPAPPPANGGKAVIGDRFVINDGGGRPVMTLALATNGDVIIEINDHGTVRRVNLTELSRNRWL